MGHSTVVFLMTGILGGGYSMASNVGGEVQDALTFVAAILAVALLGGIGLLNARVSVDIYREWSELRKRNGEEQAKVAEASAQQALRTAFSAIPFIQKAFERVDSAGKMYWVGFLFGLSFDTATQVGLIGLTAVTGSQGTLPLWMVMIFPVCFSCGMCLVDTCNGLLMIATYGRSDVRPAQKLLYNFLVTAMSACIALVIGTLELLQVVASQEGLSGPFWSWIQDVDMGKIGLMIMGVFLMVFSTAKLLSWVQDRRAKEQVCYVSP